MKQMRLLIVTLFAAVLPMELLGNTVIKELNSTFTGNEYGIANETYSEGTLTTSEGNTWTWREGGEAKSPVISMAEVDGWNCLSVKPKTSQFAMVTDFSVPGNIQEIFCAFGGNVGMVIVDFGERTFSYNLNIPDDGKIHYYSFGYSDMNLSSTNANQVVQMVFTPKDESSDLPMYIQRVNITTEVAAADNNDIVSEFGDYEGEGYTLIANDRMHNWYFSLPEDGTEVEKYNTQWNDEMCVYMRATGGSSTYPRLTLTPDFPIEGKVKKVIVKAGGDIHHISYTSPYGDYYESAIAGMTVPFYDEFTLDFGEGLDVDGNFSFGLYVGRNTYLNSITLVMEGGTIEFTGIVSSFSDWVDEEVTESSKSGTILTKEDTPWFAYFYDPETPVRMTTLYMSESSTLPTEGGSSDGEVCLAIGSYTDGTELQFEMGNMFPVKGHIKKIIVRYTGHLEAIGGFCQEWSTGENLQDVRTNAYPSGDFTEAELIFDGVTEYEDARIILFLNGNAPIFLQSITIVQDEGTDDDLLHGKCGDNLEYALTELPYTIWVWDSASEQSVQKPALKLTITGTGEMYDYDDWENLAPWREEYCEQIGEIELPEGMTRVGNEAFDDCYNAHISGLPSTLQSIGSYAFYGISYWPSEDLHLPEGLYSIEYSAFRYCGGIKNLYIPASLAYISDAAFSSLYDIENFYVDEANPYFKVDGVAIIDTRYNRLVAATLNTVIPSYVEEIGGSAFSDLAIEDITIPENVVTIGSQAFSWTKIQNLVIPNSVTTIRSYAFYACRNLQTVVIGTDVIYIDSNPFYISNNITDVYCFANPDALTWTSGNYENKSFMENKATKMHVYAADLAKYEEKFSFLNVTFVGDLADWEDGIKEIKDSKDLNDPNDLNAGWFDLSGRKWSMVNGQRSMPQGIYIRGGKKFMVK